MKIPYLNPTTPSTTKNPTPRRKGRASRRLGGDMDGARRANPPQRCTLPQVVPPVKPEQVPSKGSVRCGVRPRPRRPRRSVPPRTPGTRLCGLARGRGGSPTRSPVPSSCLPSNRFLYAEPYPSPLLLNLLKRLPIPIPKRPRVPWRNDWPDVSVLLISYIKRVIMSRVQAISCNVIFRPRMRNRCWIDGWRYYNRCRWSKHVRILEKQKYPKSEYAKL